MAFWQLMYFSDLIPDGVQAAVVAPAQSVEIWACKPDLLESHNPPASPWTCFELSDQQVQLCHVLADSKYV